MLMLEIRFIFHYIEIFFSKNNLHFCQILSNLSSVIYLFLNFPRAYLNSYEPLQYRLPLSHFHTLYILIYLF